MTERETIKIVIEGWRREVEDYRMSKEYGAETSEGVRIAAVIITLECCITEIEATFELLDSRGG